MGAQAVEAPMQGTVVSVDVSPGDVVRPGQQLLVIESMKMEHVIAAETGGQVVTVTQGGASIAQNWRNLSGERARSNFDQRHQMMLQAQYTTGVGAGGGALLTGWKAALFKEWTFASQMTVGSGLPLTPIYLAPVTGTGVTGNLRPDITGASVNAAPPGLSLNPAAYRVPASGQWGNAGRN